MHRWKNREELAELFTNKYTALFNSCNKEDKVEKIRAELNNAIVNSTKEDMTDLINEDIVAEAIGKLKSE